MDLLRPQSVHSCPGGPHVLLHHQLNQAEREQAKQAEPEDAWREYIWDDEVGGGVLLGHHPDHARLHEPEGQVGEVGQVCQSQEDDQ